MAPVAPQRVLAPTRTSVVSSLATRAGPFRTCSTTRTRPILWPMPEQCGTVRTRPCRCLPRMPSTRSTTRWRSRRKLSLVKSYHFVVRSQQTRGGSLNRVSSLSFRGVDDNLFIPIILPQSSQLCYNCLDLKGKYNQQLVRKTYIHAVRYTWWRRIRVGSSLPADKSWSFSHALRTGNNCWWPGLGLSNR